MAKVFVTQDAPFDLRKAEKFGELVILAGRKHEVSMIRGSVDNQHLISHMRRVLKEYDPTEDFILPVGSPIMAGLAFTVLGSLKDRVAVNILKWEKYTQDYVPIYLQ